MRCSNCGCCYYDGDRCPECSSSITKSLNEEYNYDIDEVWKPIKDFECLYEINNLGEIRSLDREVIYSNGVKHIHKGKMLKPRKDKYGYLNIVLNKNGKSKTFKVHRLVAITFIPNPNNLPEVNHKDENKLNNSINNLEWCTSKYNCNYGNHSKNISKSLTGRTLSEQTKKLMSDSRSIKVVQLSLNDELIKIWNSLRETDKFGYNHSCVSACCRGIKKTHRGFKWIYYNDYILMEGK